MMDDGTVMSVGLSSSCTCYITVSS